MQTAVRLVVDAVVTCRCPGPGVHLPSRNSCSTRMSLPAAKIIGEYQAALEAALQSPVPISALFKDTWHPCVPLVPALWVHLLPLMPRSLN